MQSASACLSEWLREKTKRGISAQIVHDNETAMQRADEQEGIEVMKYASASKQHWLSR